MATKPRPDIRFMVDVQSKTDSDGGRLCLTVTPVVIEEGKIRNPSFGWSDRTGAGEYDGLNVEARCGPTDDDFYFGTDIIAFDIYRVDARRAEALVKTFRRLQKRFDYQDGKWGRPTDSADILARLANAVGSTDRNCFGRKEGGSGWSYDDFEYRWMDIDALRYHLQAKIKEWKGDDS
jgi:hypothetical protein